MKSSNRSVGELLARVVVPLLVLMFVLGMLGVFGVYRTNEAVGRVVEQVAPAQRANNAYLQAMTDAETGVRGWSLTGEDSALQPYRSAMERLPDLAAELREHVGLREGLPDLTDQLVAAAEEWQRVYARPRLAAEPGLKGYSAERFVAGKTAFDKLRASSSRVDQELEKEADAARELGERAYRRAIIAVVFLTLVAAGLGMVLVRRLRREVAEPLQDLERTVERLAAGDIGARAQVSGPREVTKVATALNRMAAENERAQALESATHARMLDLDQAKTDFVSNVSHELRTPLTSIQGYLELLRDEVDDSDPGVAKMWQVVDRNVKRLGVLVEDLLTLANMESRHTTLTEVNLSDLVDDVVVDLRIAAANKDVSMNVDYPSRPPFVLADKTQLLRALLNVVSNAVKFARTGGRVDIRLYGDGDEAVLTVRDTGIGIPAAELEHLGSRFFRGSNAVQLEIGGTGLGVRMVQAILAKHGGSVSFHSVENEFTLVTMRLPRRAQPDWSEQGTGDPEEQI